MNRYRVKINGIDCGVYDARNIDEAQKLAEKEWQSISADKPYSFWITREG